jgi:hypothetical protein
MADELPNISVSEIKERLFGPNVQSKKVKDYTYADELKQITEGQNSKVKVDSMKDIFNQPIQSLPTYAPVYHKSVNSFDDNGKDELLYNYASFRDEPAKKKFNIFDDLTELEVTYEKVNLNSEGKGIEVKECNDEDFIETNVKRLSISNVRKFEEMLEKKLGDDYDRTKIWLSGEKENENKKSTNNNKVIPKRSYSVGSAARPPSDAPSLTSDGPNFSERIGLPRKKADDMAFRKMQQANLSSASIPSFVWPTGSYLNKLPNTSERNIPLKQDSKSDPMLPDPIVEKLSSQGYEKSINERGRSNQEKRQRFVQIYIIVVFVNHGFAMLVK